VVRPCVLRHRVTVLHAMPPRRTRNSDRPRASDRTMVSTELNRLPSFKNRRALAPLENEPRERKSNPEKNSRAIESHLQTVGWISRQKISRLPAEGEAFLLTSPFIELPISFWDCWCEAGFSQHLIQESQAGYFLRSIGGPLTRVPWSLTFTSTRSAILIKGMPLFIP
jgi:hypothetical protein